MKKQLLILLCLLLSTLGFSQKKSELIAQIDELKTEISTVQQELAGTKRKISSSEAKAETLANENVALRDANQTLLQNLSSFSELSKKNSQNVNTTLAALGRKEKQLSNMTSMIASNDSVAIVLLSKIKQSMGSDAKANFVEGEIVISNSLNTLFGADNASEITEEGKAWLEKVSKVIKTNPTQKIEVEGLNITGEFGATFDQATTISKELVETYEVSSERINISVKDGNFKEGINIKLQPDYKSFYDSVKQNAKNK
ncbi:MAG: hypothetical protein AAF348_13520 [Bacteroidota bacterium]